MSNAHIASRHRRRSFYVAWTTCLLALVSKFVFFLLLLVLHVVPYGKTTTTEAAMLVDAVCKVNLCCVSLGNSFSVGWLFVANIESDSRGEKWLELETDQFSSAAAADFFLVLVKVGRFLLRSAL